MRVALLLVGLLIASSIRADGTWFDYPIHPEGADCTFEERGETGFALTAVRTDTNETRTIALAISNVDRDTWTHDKVVFSVRAIGGKAITLSPCVSWKNAEGDATMSWAPPITVAGRAWRQVVLGLDNDFRLGDRAILVRQAKLSFRVGDWAEGESGGIEVKDFKVCGPSEIAESTAFREGDSFVVTRGKLNPERKAARGDALKVYFDFDNEDVRNSISRRKKGLVDPQQYGGFRETLLEHLDGAATWTDDLDAADVIVSTRCRTAPETAARIAALVREKGVPLYVTSAVRDTKIAALLPCTLSGKVPQDLPVRSRIVAATNSVLAAQGGYSDAPFAIFRRVTPKEGATTLFAFENGAPAVVEGMAGNGRVVYSAIGIGTSFVPGKTARDAFFIRMLGYLAGRTLKEDPRKTDLADAEGWRRGNDGFGHFGWEVGNGFLVENTSSRLGVLKDGVGYEFAMPRAPVPEGGTSAVRRTTFACDRMNPLCTGGEITTDGKLTHRYDGSLAYPGLRWQFYAPVVDVYLANTATFAAWQTTNGVATVDLAAGEAIDCGAWKAPWLLVWDGSDGDSPLLFVFAKVPKAITAFTTGKGLTITARDEAVGAVVPTWISGSKIWDTTDWKTAISAEAMAAIARWYPRAFHYPVNARESFRIRDGRVEIRNEFEYLDTADDFATATRDYAALPPVAALVGTRGEAWFKLLDGAKPTDTLVTRYGPLQAFDGTRRLAWSLPVPPTDLSLLPHVTGYGELDDLANRQFAAGIVYTCGGHVKVNYKLDREGPSSDPSHTSNGQAMDLAADNLSMHQSLLGLARASENPFAYSYENRYLLRRRFAWRISEPLEDIYYKMTCRWRAEPFSGRRYAIYMNSPRDISTVYAPEALGSKIIYGDSNETVRMIYALVQRMADRMGQEGVVAANWDTLSRDVFSYHRAIDDWAYMVSGCLEWGGPGTVDMLNGECDAMMLLARLAEIAGDEDVRAEAIYRAARRMCPTLARFLTREYFAANGMPASDIGTGFDETGAVFRHYGSHFWECEYYDMSQGIPGTLRALYEAWGTDALKRSYLPRVAAATAENDLNYIAASILAIAKFGTPESWMAKVQEARQIEKLDRFLMNDWPGIDTGSYLEYVLHGVAGSPVITDCRGVDLHDARFDPATRTLTIEATATSRDARIAVDGKPLEGLAANERKTLTVTTK